MNVCSQYYKCPITSVEMDFQYNKGIGWTVWLPNGVAKGMRTLRDNNVRVQFPPCPKGCEQEEKEFYENLEKIVGREE